MMQVKSYVAKQAVLHKGDTGADLYFLLDGQLQVVDLSVDGHDVGLDVIKAGNAFGYIALFDEQPRSASMIALTEVSVAILPKSLALKLCYDHPVVMHRLLIILASVIRHTNSFRSVLSQSSAKARICSVLLDLMRPNVAGLLTIDNLPKQQELAIIANTSRETVSRVMKGLMEQGIVEKDLRSLIIRMPDALETLSKESDVS
jgi:CRP-like cAMP-binding protein